MRRLFIVMFLLGFYAGIAGAQTTVPVPKIDIEWDHSAEYDWAYPAGAVEPVSASFIKGYRFEFTRVGETTPASTVFVPKAQVLRNQGILRVNGVQAIIGSQTLVVRVVNYFDVVSGASSPIPFVSMGPAPSAVTGLKVFPQK